MEVDHEDPCCFQNCLQCDANCTLLYNMSSDFNVSAAIFDPGYNFVLPWWQQLVWYVLFGGMVIVATGGNLIVIWIVLAHRRMRTVTNYFLVNLSVTDTMMSTLNTVFNSVYMQTMHWPFGDAQCKITMFVSMFSVAGSVFTLVAISIDRYTAIMHPLRPRMSRTVTVIIIVFVWLAAGALCAPNWMYANTTHHPVGCYGNGTDKIVCFLMWPDGGQGSSHTEFIYNIVLMVVTYILPITVMSFTYLRIGKELWGSRSIGEVTARQLDSVKSKRRVVKMMMVVVIIFAFCWLPYHVYFLVTYIYPELNQSPYIQPLYLAIYWLAMSNSMYNPIIYCWMNARFRRGFKVVFRWCPFIKLTDSDIGERRNYATTRTSCSGSPDHMTRIERNGTVIVPLNAIGGTNGSLGSSPRDNKHGGSFFKRKKLGHTT